MIREQPKPPPLSYEIIILAGGLSSRMGRDKSRIRIGRRTMLGHIRALAARLNLPVRVLRHDAVPRCGPLGGIYTALAASRADAIIFLACDMPFVTPAFLNQMLKSFQRLVYKIALPPLPFPGERTRPRVQSDAPSRRTIYDGQIHAAAENDKRRTSSLPLLRGEGKEDILTPVPSPTAVFASHKNLLGLPCLLHRETALPIVTRQLAASKLSLQSLARALKAKPLRPARRPAHQLRNLNTPADLQSARPLLP